MPKQSNVLRLLRLRLRRVPAMTVLLGTLNASRSKNDLFLRVCFPFAERFLYVPHLTACYQSWDIRSVLPSYYVLPMYSKEIRRLCRLRDLVLLLSRGFDRALP